MSDAPKIGRPGQYVPEPFVSRAHETGEMPLDILDIIKLGRERVVHVDDEDLDMSSQCGGAFTAQVLCDAGACTFALDADFC